MYSIKTPHLLLHLPNSDWAERLLEYELENRTFFEPFRAKRDDSFFTLDHQKERLVKALKNAIEGSENRFWITPLDAPDIIIGDIGLSNIVRGCFLSCHLGYKMDQAHNGKGLMTEAIAGIVDFAFKKLQLHRIEANILPSNIASKRVLEKNGFEKEGLARRYLKINGIWEDHFHYVILNDASE